MEISPRVVQFDDLSEVIADAEALQRSGYSSLGEWSLGQTCTHLSSVMRAFIEGFPEPPSSARFPLWLTRNTLARFGGGREMLIRTVTGSIETFPEMVPSSDVVDADGLDALRDWVARTKGHDGAFSSSPSVGVLGAQELDALHRLHCAHHLGFLMPTARKADTAGRA
ncbi:MAG: DUF1569 domain-containing protein [Coriobacteriia bacterium]|nr:DUF1569 domain-containing protein [Coriobacteriia bacterium]